MKLRQSCLLLATLAGLLVGCGGGPTTVRIYYRFTNVVPDVATADFYVNDQLQSAAIGYAQSNSWVRLEDDEDWTFYDAFEGGTQTPLDSIAVRKQNKVSTHVIACGFKTPGSQQPGVRLVPVTVTRTTPGGSNARLIWVHAYMREVGVQTPNVDIFRTGKISPEISDLAFGDTRVGFLAAGTYTFTVRITGTLQGFLIERPNVVLEAGKIYIVLLKGVENETGVLTPDIELIEEEVLNNP